MVIQESLVKGVMMENPAVTVLVARYMLTVMYRSMVIVRL